MTDEPHGTFLERWSRLYTLPRSEIIAARIAVGLVLFLGLAVSFTQFGIRLALAIWLGLVVYVLALVFLLRSVVHVQNRPAPWPFWPYFCAAAIAGALAALVEHSGALRPLVPAALASGLVYGGFHWVLVRLLQRLDRA